MSTNRVTLIGGTFDGKDVAVTAVTNGEIRIPHIRYMAGQGEFTSESWDEIYLVSEDGSSAEFVEDTYAGELFAEAPGLGVIAPDKE